MTKITIPAILNSYRPLADKSWSVNLNLQEPSREQKEVIDYLHQKSVVVLIKAGEISPDEMEMMDEIDVELGGKSQSQRIRNTLYVCWQQNNEGFEDFKDYYIWRTDRILEWLKKPLKPKSNH